MSDTDSVVTLKAGDEAPHFKLTSNGGKEIDLNAFRGEKNVVLYFYPKDSTPGCTVEACDFRDQQENFSGLDTVVLGVSRDSVASHERFIEKQNLNFPLLSDPDTVVCKAYGIFKLKKNYGKEYMGIERSTFVIGKDGRLLAALYGIRVKGHVEAIHTILKEKHAENG